MTDGSPVEWFTKPRRTHLMDAFLLDLMLVSLIAAAVGPADESESPSSSKSISSTNLVARWPDARARCVPASLKEVEIGGFLGERIDQNLDSVMAGLDSAIPRGFEARARGEDPPPETRRLAADSDLYKWLEGASYVFARTEDERLGLEIDRIADLILKCQQEDGYINTQVPPKSRFDPKVNHDLYIAGHFFEAAVAHARATGRKDLLDAACRWADYLISEYERGNPYYETVGSREHPEYELGFLRLGRAAKRPEYVEMACALARCATVGPMVRDIHAGAGKLHAVRTGYLLTGMAELYLETGEEDMVEHLSSLWKEIRSTRTYVTGAVGSHGERISETPFDLPPSREGEDHRHLGETCACVSMIMFAWRMHAITGESECFDAIERALYNHYLGAISLDNLGNFYYNPLHVVGDLSRKTDHGHRPLCARCRLPEIHSTACCMPNAWRFFGALPEYVFSCDSDGIFVNLYTLSTIRHTLPDGRLVHLSIDTQYPWEGTVRFRFLGKQPTSFCLRLRIPEWCHEATWTADSAGPEALPGGRYKSVERTWEPGETSTLSLPMAPRVIVPDPRNKAVSNTAVLARGPMVYCLEKEDVEEPVETASVSLSPERLRSAIQEEWQGDLLGGIYTLQVPGNIGTPSRPAQLKMIPFYTRANRSQDSRWIVFLPLR